MSDYKVTLKGPSGGDLTRIAKALRYLLVAGESEWDSPVPDVDFEVIETFNSLDEIFAAKETALS